MAIKPLTFSRKRLIMDHQRWSKAKEDRWWERLESGDPNGFDFITYVTLPVDEIFRQQQITQLAEAICGCDEEGELHVKLLR
jgi:hypothetical protein